MSRSICLTLAVSLVLAGCNLAHSQDAQNTNPPAASAPDSSAPAGDDVATLQAENAALKKEVADAKQTIATLQTALAQAGIKNQATTSSAESPAPANPPDAAAAADNTAPDTNAAPAGPLKALPLDDTNAVANAAAPGASTPDAGPSKTYKVVKGDSLWKIAHKMYPGDTKNGVDKIEEANKDAIGGKPLKIGQVLIIPQ